MVIILCSLWDGSILQLRTSSHNLSCSAKDLELRKKASINYAKLIAGYQISDIFFVTGIIDLQALQAIKFFCNTTIYVTEQMLVSFLARSACQWKRGVFWNLLFREMRSCVRVQRTKLLILPAVSGFASGEWPEGNSACVHHVWLMVSLPIAKKYEPSH